MRFWVKVGCSTDVDTNVEISCSVECLQEVGEGKDAGIARTAKNSLYSERASSESTLRCVHTDRDQDR